MIKFKYVLICTFILFTCFPVHAHQDRIIELKNGKLIGLPDKYQPSYFDLETKTLQIGNNRLKFPSCVSRYFPDDEFKLYITSSWYHHSKDLPPYIVLIIEPKNRDFKYELVFELDTLRPYRFEIYVPHSETTTAIHRIEINNYCKESIEKLLNEYKK